MQGPLGRLAERLYAREIARRNRRWDAGRGVIRFDRAVISVGNLSVGGTGKTPMVAWVLNELVNAGRRPCVAMRGYGKGSQAQSDEEALHRQAFPGVPVVARPGRAEGLIELFASEAGRRVDVIVLDDGFQHRRIARDLDIVLIDATRDPFEDHLLPRGWLREGPASLTRSDAIVLTHVEQVSLEAAARTLSRLALAAPRALFASCAHEWDCLDQVFPEGAPPRSMDSLAGQHLALACAIGNPEAFVAQARAGAGASGRVEPVILRDHAPYTSAQLSRIRAACIDADALLTTAKDWTKLARSVSGPAASEPWPCPVLVPRLSLAWRSGEAALAERVRTATCGDPPA